jgi:hypothetical protein
VGFLPENERKYKTVAETLGVTVGRASVYMRDALRLTGRIDEAPRGERGNGESAPQTPEAMMQAEVAKLRQRIEADKARVREAQEAAQGFDADQWREAEAKRPVDAVREANAAADAFKNNAEGIATKAAEAEAKRRTDRAAKVEADLAKSTEALRWSLAGYEAALQPIGAAD